MTTLVRRIYHLLVGDPTPNKFTNLYNKNNEGKKGENVMRLNTLNLEYSRVKSI